MGAVPVVCSRREPWGQEMQAGPEESGKAMEEDVLVRGPEGFCKPALLLSHLPGRTQPVLLSPLPMALIWLGSWRESHAFALWQFVLVLKEKIASRTFLPSTAEAYSSTNNREPSPPCLLTL